MSEWIYFLHPPRENFAATMTEDEAVAFRAHFLRLQQLHADGVLIIAGPTLGPTNTGVAVFEAPDEEAAQQIVDGDPVIQGGFGTGELRPYRVSLLRGRD